MSALPDKLSELIRVAIADNRKLMDNPLYVFNPYVWHDLIDDDPHAPCEICIAGGVIAGTLKSDRLKRLSPHDYRPETRVKLGALDCCRLGHLKEAFIHLGRDFPDGIAPRWAMPRKAGDLEGVLTTMADMAETLESHGL